ncbi:MAG: hypothetical protein ABI832_10510 [bacterium]
MGIERERQLEGALLEYVERYGATSKAREAFYARLEDAPPAMSPARIQQGVEASAPEGAAAFGFGRVAVPLANVVPLRDGVKKKHDV